MDERKDRGTEKALGPDVHVKLSTHVDIGVMESSADVVEVSSVLASKRH